MPPFCDKTRLTELDSYAGRLVAVFTQIMQSTIVFYLDATIASFSPIMTV